MRVTVLIESIASLIVFIPKPTLSLTTSTVSGYLGIPVTEQLRFFLLEYRALKHPVRPTYAEALCKAKFNYPCNLVPWWCPCLHQAPQGSVHTWSLHLYHHITCVLSQDPKSRSKAVQWMSLTLKNLPQCLTHRKFWRCILKGTWTRHVGDSMASIPHQGKIREDQVSEPDSLVWAYGSSEVHLKFIQNTKQRLV